MEYQAFWDAFQDIVMKYEGRSHWAKVSFSYLPLCSYCVISTITELVIGQISLLFAFNFIVRNCIALINLYCIKVNFIRATKLC